MSSASGRVLDRADINLSWLLKLRWGAVLGQLALILAVHLVVPVSLPLAPLFLIIATTVVTNLLATVWARTRSVSAEALTIALMALDVLLLTSLLHLSGGPSNPFSTLYLVNIALAAILLPARWTWFLVGLSSLGFGALFFWYRPLPVLLPQASAPPFPLQLEGAWMSFAITALFIVYFATRVSSALEQRERELRVAREVAARTERLASLATLAAGAAHELSTPLSTIAVVAKELERQLERTQAAVASIEDARLIREQVQRCRRILDQMSADAGASAGEAFERVLVPSFIEAALEEGPILGTPVRVEVQGAARAATIRVPPHALAQALRSVLKNALDAGEPGSEITLRAALDGAECRFEVEDHGAGMTPEVAARAGEPFFTTKEPGRGMGLGLFLTRTVLEGLGGRLEIHSEPRQGTRVSLILPSEPHPEPTSGVSSAGAR